MSEVETVIRKPSQLLNLGVYVFGTFFLLIAMLAKPYVANALIPLIGESMTFRIHNGYYWIIYLVVGLWMFYEFLVVYVVSYQVTGDRLIYRHGLIVAVRDETELFRIKDYQLSKPLIYRPFSLSNLVIESSDKSHPVMRMPAIRNGEAMMQIIRDRVDEMRQKKGVREFD